MMKLALVLIEPRMSTNSTASRIRLRICEGRMKPGFPFWILIGSNNTRVRLLLGHPARASLFRRDVEPVKQSGPRLGHSAIIDRF
jgi:hypothetical protein